MHKKIDPARIETRFIDLNLIDDHPENYNLHPPDQVVQLSESHENIGQYRSIVVWARPGGRFIRVTGHGYSEGATRRGETQLLAGILPEDTPPETIKAIMLADNLHARNSQPDDALLAHLLQEQQDLGFDLSALGTDAETLRQMLEEIGEGFALGEREPGEGGDDFAVELPEGPTRTQPGQIWQLGEHRLLVGDCTDSRCVRLLLDGRLADCCWTDPPYGVSYVGKTKDALTIRNDGREDIAAFLGRAFAVLDEALKDGAAIYVAHPAGALSVTFGLCFLSRGWRLHQTLIWVKDSMVLGHSDYHYRHEPILFGYKAVEEGRRGRGGPGWYGDNAATSVFEIPRPKRSEEHPTMKPIELIQEMLANSCPPGGLVYEPFAGSGSTMIAAHRLQMRCFMCELDPRYADVVIQRYEAETGEEASLLEEL